MKASRLAGEGGRQLDEDSERQRNDRPFENYDHDQAFRFALDALINNIRFVLARTMKQKIDALSGI